MDFKIVGVISIDVWEVNITAVRIKRCL